MKEQKDISQAVSADNLWGCCSSDPIFIIAHQLFGLGPIELELALCFLNHDDLLPTDHLEYSLAEIVAAGSDFTHLICSRIPNPAGSCDMKTPLILQGLVAVYLSQHGLVSSRTL
jgi:hypothetical protein